MSFLIRKGTSHDIPGIYALIKELATYERAPEAVINTEKILEADGFGDKSIYRVYVAEEASTGHIIGMALYFTAYSTWKGKIIYLDDLVVTERFRRFGIGRKLMNAVLREAQQDGAAQVRWQVLEWNTPAIDFYKSMGAELDPEWINCRMGKEEVTAYLNTQT